MAEAGNGGSIVVIQSWHCTLRPQQWIRWDRIWSENLSLVWKETCTTITTPPRVPLDKNLFHYHRHLWFCKNSISTKTTFRNEALLLPVWKEALIQLNWALPIFPKKTKSTKVTHAYITLYMTPHGLPNTKRPRLVLLIELSSPTTASSEVVSARRMHPPIALSRNHYWFGIKRCYIISAVHRSIDSGHHLCSYCYCSWNIRISDSSSELCVCSSFQGLSCKLPACKW